jgi:adenosylmethionine-8-amino-7-oxononanoate transaminase
MTRPSLIEQDHRHLWHPFTQMRLWNMETPLIIERAEGVFLIDTEGRRYLDGVSSLWVNVHGHRHPALDAALREQLAKVAHTTLLGLSNVPAIELATKLCQIAPASLKRVFYSDSGSTAVEIALKLAFQYWQLRGQPRRTRFLALDQAYHGDTLGAVSVGGIDLFHQIFHPLLFAVDRIPSPFSYRCRLDPTPHTPNECAQHCLAALDRQLDAHGQQIAALIVEPRVQGAAGMIVHPPGFLRSLAQRCRTHGILLICDEVATGFGRTGALFACQAEDVSPDVMAVAKGLTGGYLALAATLTTDEIYEAFCGDYQRTFFHGHSYTGNPLAAAVALASIDQLEASGLIATVTRSAALLTKLLAQSVSHLDLVGDIRQCGLMVGIELVADRESRTPFPTTERLGARVCYDARRRGVIVRPVGDVIILMPPLVVGESELQLLVDAIAASILFISETRTGRAVSAASSITHEADNQ